MKDKTRIAVLVSGGGTNLQALIDSEKRGEIPDGEIVLVVGSREGIYALERAEKAGIEHTVVHKDEEKLIKVLEEHHIELIILAGYLTILSADFTKRYANRIINIHPSLIPSFCGKGMYGLKVHEAALSYGVKVSGATVHLVNEIPDGGRILLQKAVEVQDGDTPEILQRRIMEQAEWKLLPKAAEMISKEIREAEG
ncbi:phosphoribosylglycinamide formyltransferase [Oribacterium sp. HCP28S3_H8]|uniref:phosphoribosylglycinamide formyltransferase n=1 Tax=Oribacterium sp. HCP28S3_H8 TaxID=3438945 RepID=UPI003F8C2A4C